MNMNSGSRRQARILVADDDQTLAMTLCAILEEQGYEVATAFSGEEAVTKSTWFIPDLFVSDICMRTMNGVEAATRITAKIPECGVLFLSGLVSITDVVKTAPVRLVYSFASKPLHTLDLLNAIAYKLSAIGTADDSAAMGMEQIALQNDVIGRTPAKAGFILGKSGAGADSQVTRQGIPDAVFFDRSQQETPGLRFLLQ